MLELPPLTGLEAVIRQLGKRPARLHLLYGHSSVYATSLLISSATQQPAAVIDGAMRFNSYTLSRIAKVLNISPRKLLQQTHVTRSFTAFQTEAAIRDKLPRFLRSAPCRTVVILGLLDTYYDEQVSPYECRQSLCRVLKSLAEMIQRNIHIIISDVQVDTPPRGKESLFTLIYGAAHHIAILRYTENQLMLNEHWSSHNGTQ